MPSSSLAQPLQLPCGATLPNRIAKAAMTEGLADEYLHATECHERLYGTWSDGGAGLLITGNVMVDRHVLERPGNVAIDPAPAEGDPEGMDQLCAWAAAGTRNGNHLWMQISHAGRQSPRYVTNKPVGPSAVQLELMGNYARPRALEEPEILDIIQRFANVARIARDAGFTGVQVHSAHGYLLSSFLSPVTNQRNDRWGGSLENRARLLLETVRAVRATVGPDFPVAVKLNSDDFRKGGFSHEECLKVVRWLNDENIDLLEISGGTYEQPRLLGHSGDASTAKDDRPAVRESTKAREAYFLDYAEAIRKVCDFPLMVTGGFRTRTVMEEALAGGNTDVIGLGRPLCTNPETPRALMDGTIEKTVSYERDLRLARRGLFSPASPLMPLKVINVIGGQAWYYQQIFHLADGEAPNLNLGLMRAFGAYFADEISTAMRVRKAERSRESGRR
ncbi:2,4-dienoyl-CoA reductase-like NADH-dependent reductase (Old Yellow Enzyme family) [Halospina denitrificans]|uniref:2,4-dienoyl-CoA reductase-like NADH-dependent reductase (Old Yellow Enzyme family) n=1 Tax=Halospina denitrificans TaxID=332522 RepID=A0A4R7JPX2_9GAMM|nr:NADH:flavin oxidoreductase/NADH oxidase family protein [Halospina denitrificans]TDT40211.1 2,4-dienoyl-CoA reductase-like NADH-dependent reductase (Old Yellow Enzyme family) [Halospina denitrificans]